MPGVFHVVFGLTTPLLGFHDPLHPEFTDALHEWCAPCKPNTLAHTPTLTLALTRILTPTLTLLLPLTRFFRSGLDHLVWVFGMVCAFLFPFFDRQLQAHA